MGGIAGAKAESSGITGDTLGMVGRLDDEGKFRPCLYGENLARNPGAPSLSPEPTLLRVYMEKT